MMGSMKFKLLVGALLLAVTRLFADGSEGLSNTVVLVIRHAEKPDDGNGLTPAGEERAKAYVHYFKNFTVDAKPVTVNYLFAAADSEGSHRPRLTLEPLSQGTGMTIDQRFTAKQPEPLAKELRAKPHGGCILICWHHGQIPDLLQALGANPKELLPKGKWPDNTFGWVIQLRYDAQGQFVKATRINEKLMPDDAGMQEDLNPVP